MAATRSKKSHSFRLTPAGRLVVFIVAMVLLAAWVFSLRASDQNEPIPSFSDALGPLDHSKVPNGWAPAVEKAAKVAGVPAPILAAQLETESSWDPKAESRVGAQGLAQFTPDAWQLVGSGDPFDPHASIAAQGRLLKYLLKRIDASGLKDNRIKLALAGYNGGIENVMKYRGVPPFEETRGYVMAIAKRMGYYAQPIAQPSTGKAGASAPHGTTVGSVRYRREGYLGSVSHRPGINA